MLELRLTDDIYSGVQKKVAAALTLFLEPYP
jgi:hypothetical protein